MNDSARRRVSWKEVVVVGVVVKGALVLLREVWVSGMGVLSLLC